MSSKRTKFERETEMELQKRIIENRKRQIEAKNTLQQFLKTDDQPADTKRPDKVINVFSNDGSFLEQYKQKIRNACEKTNNTFDKFINNSMQINNSVNTTVSYPDINQIYSMDSSRSSNEATIKSLAKLVAERGDKIEETISSQQNPNFWFLSDKSSRMYQYFRSIVTEFRNKNPDVYEPEETFQEDDKLEKKRKRKSRWSEDKVKLETIDPITTDVERQNFQNNETTEDNKVNIDFSNPEFTQYLLKTFGSLELTEQQLVQAKEHYKIHYLYQSILKKREGLDRLHKFFKKNIVDDVNEDITVSTWEHNLRTQEMELTKLWSEELNKNASGKHHIGDFLPISEMEKFLKTCNKNDTSTNDDSEQKLNETNVGFKMLAKLGWKQGQGLGSKSDGIVEPVKSSPAKETKEGLGTASSLQEHHPNNENEQYDLYRKRMMLAYRFRPNPLNNPRRPYY